MASSGGAERKAPEPRKTPEPNWWQKAVRSGWGQAARWLAVLGLVLWRWAEGLPSDFKGWVPVLIISVLLLLPDADSVAFGGVKLEMRQTREEVAGIRQQIMQLQVAQARSGAIGTLSVATDNPAVAKEIGAAIGMQAQIRLGEESESEPYDPGPR
jgi:hypothetical protein